MSADPERLRCIHCGSRVAVAPSGDGDALECIGCSARYPVRHRIPAMLMSHDQVSSLESATQLTGYQAPVFFPDDLSDRSLGAASWMRLLRAAVVQAGRFVWVWARLRGGRPVRKTQARVKEKYERSSCERMNYYLASMERQPVLLNGKLREATLFRVRKELVTEILRVAREVGATRVLEVGAGDGMNFWALEQYFSGHGLELIGFDYSFFRSSLATCYLPPTVDIFNGDAKHIALDDASVDLAYTCYCLEQLPHDNHAVLKEMARVARHVLLIEPFPEVQNVFGRCHNYLADYPVDLVENVARAGLEVIHRRPLRLGSPFCQAGVILARSLLP